MDNSVYKINGAKNATVYQVGGAVRDRLLGRKPIEFDWLVVGATPQNMLNAGFKQVGQDFPVFLHPTSQDEYALARTERKSGQGYAGFEVFAAPEVSAEDDLLRRDLTINAIAQSQNGDLIDPFNGQADLDNRLLRHVLPAFAEDPLRILRVARFYARYAYLGFSIADETMDLMRSMVEQGEAGHLVAERVWQETRRALGEDRPEKYFEALRDCGALKVIFPEIDALYGVPQPALHHPEIDTGIHTMMVLQACTQLSGDYATRFAALCHDLGKALSPPEKWPSHHGHEGAGLEPLKNLCLRLRVDKDTAQLAALVCAEHGNIHKAFELKAQTLLKLLEKLGALKAPKQQGNRLHAVLDACTADARGRTGFENRDYPQAGYLKAAAACAVKIQAKDVMDGILQGPQISAAVQAARLRVLKQFKREYQESLQSLSTFTRARTIG